MPPWPFAVWSVGGQQFAPVVGRTVAESLLFRAPPTPMPTIGADLLVLTIPSHVEQSGQHVAHLAVCLQQPVELELERFRAVAGRRSAKLEVGKARGRVERLQGDLETLNATDV